MLSKNGRLHFGFWMFVHWMYFKKNKQLKKWLELCVYLVYDCRIIGVVDKKEAFLAAAMAAHALNHCRDLIDHEMKIARFLGIDTHIRSSSFCKTHGERVTTIYNGILQYQKV